MRVTILEAAAASSASSFETASETAVSTTSMKLYMPSKMIAWEPVNRPVACAHHAYRQSHHNRILQRALLSSGLHVITVWRVAGTARERAHVLSEVSAASKGGGIGTYEASDAVPRRWGARVLSKLVQGRASRFVCSGVSNS